MSDYQLEEMCKHGFPTPVDCPICKGQVEKPKPSKMVYVTEYGEVYHYSMNCHALEIGHERVRERGGTPAPIEQVPEASVVNDRPACTQCRPKKST